MPKPLINNLTTKERRDLEDPDPDIQDSPLWDTEEIEEAASALGIIPMPISRA